MPRPTTRGAAAGKRTVADLALFGGPAAFGRPLHVGRPNIGDGDRLRERIDGALDRRILTNRGPLVREFEERIARITGARHVICVANGTLGLQVAARATGLGGEVIVPSFTFVATPHALEWIGLRPIFCDVDPVSLTIDPASAARLITSATSGIVAVHLWERVCDTEAIAELADASGLRVIYDAAHAFGSSAAGKQVGSFGDAEVFSFHATKWVNSFEGGAITTDDDDIAERARLMINFGFDGWDHTASAGINAKMHEASAAMGLTSLDEMAAIRRQNLRASADYAAGLVGIDGLTLMRPADGDITSSHHIVVRVDASAAALGRDLMVDVLVAEGVLARRYFHPGCHRLEPYASTPSSAPMPLPNTDLASRGVLSLPTGPTVSTDDIEQVCDLIRFSAENAKAIEERASRTS